MSLPLSLPERDEGRRLLDLKKAGEYLGVSEWTVRDWVAVGVLPCVRLPVVRLNKGRRKSGKSNRYELAAPNDSRLRGKAVRKILVDVRDLDEFIAAHKERAAG